MRNCKILVCCHKRDVMATEEPYMPIHVGKALHPDVDLGIQGDDTGDNISLKNSSYCELTGMYWAWKNLRGVDVIGLCHYRRYFDFYKQCTWQLDIQKFPTSSFGKMNLRIPEKITENLKDGEAVVAMHKHYMSNLFLDYCSCHISDDIKTLRQIFIDTQPKYMQDAFYRIIYMNNKLIHYNMFIMTWHDFDEYCNWIFPILAEVERRTDISHYNPVQMRIYGYMAERLFNVWLYAKLVKLIQRPIIWFNDDMRSENPSSLRILQRRLRGWINVRLANPRMRELN